MNTYIYIIVIIIIIITVYFIYNNNAYNIYNDYITRIEGTRNSMMNGINNKYYVLFSHHFHLFKLLKKLIDEFNKNNIRYFISNGLLIGYHRHNKSFIPWDDDIDIGCFSEDKNKIRSILENIYNTDNNYKYLYETYGIDKFTYNNSSNHLIQIDIFYYKYYEDKNYYHYYTSGLINSWPREYYYMNEIDTLDQGEIKLYMPDGSLYESIVVNIPTNSTDFLDRAYPGWDKTYMIAAPHNSFYKLFFNNIVYPVKINKKID